GSADSQTLGSIAAPARQISIPSLRTSISRCCATSCFCISRRGRCDCLMWAWMAQVISSRNMSDGRYSCSRDSNDIVGVFDLHMHLAAKADVARRFDLVGQPYAFDTTKSFVDLYL